MRPECFRTVFRYRCSRRIAPLSHGLALQHSFERPASGTTNVVSSPFRGSRPDPTRELGSRDDNFVVHPCTILRIRGNARLLANVMSVSPIMARAKLKALRASAREWPRTCSGT
jgi:hypothetical protein